MGRGEARGQEDRKDRLAGLCVEELATNALKHGVSLRQRIRTGDLRVVIDGGDVIVRLWDNGVPFNLKRFAARLAEQDAPKSGMGIRILLHSAKSVSYYRTYGMNTTIIRV